MARPEKPLRPDGPLANFASGLRALRHQAGLTYRELAARTRYGVSVLSTAAGGKGLPTWEVTQAFVRECGGDPDQWRVRWEQAHERQKEWREAAAAGQPHPRASETAAASDPLERFSAGLRRLRASAELDYADLVQILKWPPNTLADVVAGRQFPGWELTRAYVGACRGNVVEWRRLWDETRDQCLACRRPGANDAAAPACPPATSAPGVLRRRVAQARSGRPYVHTDWTPRLAKVITQADFAALLRDLRNALELSYGAIQRASRVWPGVSDRGLPISTIGDLINGKTLPSEDTLMAFLSACGIFHRETWQWLAAWERTQLVSAPSRGAIRVAEADPRDLGVHAAIADGRFADMPDYIPREAGSELRDMLSAASSRGAFILIVGGAAAGKTRLAYEAVRATLPDWWLLRPDDATGLAGLAVSPIPRSVIWLDEIQRCLADDVGVAAIRALLRGAVPNVILGTIRPEHYQPHLENYARGRELLGLATHQVHVRSALAPAEREEAEARAMSDSRIRAALACKDYGLFQLLAAGPELVSRWEMPCDPYGAAVISAAVDARRLGVNSPLAAGLLRAVSQAYLSASERARASTNWFENALAYATTPLLGGASALAPVADQHTGAAKGYVAADYLVQYGRETRVDPDPTIDVWRAYLTHLADPQDLCALGNTAARLARVDQAEALYRRATAVGASTAWRGLVRLLEGQGRFGEAEQLLRDAAGSGLAEARRELVRLLKGQGRFPEAEQLLRDAAGSGFAEARRELVDLLLRQARYDDAESVLFDAVAAGQPGMQVLLAQLLEAQGREREAASLLRHAETLDVRRARAALAQRLRSRGANKPMSGVAPAGRTLTTPLPLEPFR